jgi:hypothetical protein
MYATSPLPDFVHQYNMQLPMSYRQHIVDALVTLCHACEINVKLCEPIAISNAQLVLFFIQFCSECLLKAFTISILKRLGQCLIKAPLLK